MGKDNDDIYYVDRLSPKEQKIKHRKETYYKNQHVILTKMDDPQAPPVGTRGIVRHVDDIGSIHVHWETGSSLAVTLEDECEPVINMKG